MYALGELGIGLGLAWLISYRNRAAVDFRLVLLGSVLPDLVDKPIGIVLHLEARLWAHSLIFLAGIFLASLAPRLRGLRWVGFGDAVHLLVDLIWQEPMVALWPFLGIAFPAESGPQNLDFFLQVLFTDRYVQVGEIVGGLILLTTAWYYHLFSWTRFRQFLRDGRLVRPAPAAHAPGA